MLKNNGIALFFLCIIIFLGCGGENDLTAPEIRVLESDPPLSQQMICGEWEEGYKLFSGDTFTLDLNISDNEALSELKVDIHDNFDCHGHGGSQTPSFEAPDITQQTKDWTVLDIIDLDGSEQDLTVALPVPENVTAGFYHFALQVVDASGNEAEEELIYDLNVKNLRDTMPPLIGVNVPSVPTLTVSKGGSVTFKGGIADNLPLSQGGNGLVYINYQKVNSNNVFLGPFTVFPEGTGPGFNYELTFIVPETLTNGDYTISVHAHDGVRNIAQPIYFDMKITD